MSDVKLVRSERRGVWHRADVLGCSRSKTLVTTDETETRTVPSGEWPAGERCGRCTW